MDLCEIALVDGEEIAEGTRAFRFTKPRGFDFVPGQFANFTLIDPRETDDEGPLRSFSLASGPHDHELMIATRMRPSAFKRTLATLPVGGHIEMEGPFGELALPEDDSPAVLVAGGIGITPFRSMLRDAAHRGSDRAFTLLYGNRTPQAAAFVAELEILATRLPRLEVVHVMSEPEKAAQPWRGETGLLDEALIRRHVRALALPTWYIVGPPAMTATMRAVLLNLGVDDSAVRVEDFAGY